MIVSRAPGLLEKGKEVELSEPSKYAVRTFFVCKMLEKNGVSEKYIWELYKF